MMFLSLGIGTVVAVALITVVSLLTGAASQKQKQKHHEAVVFETHVIDGQLIGPLTLPSLGRGTVQLPWNLHHPSIIVLYASWCTPCIEELPRVAAYASTHSSSSVQYFGIDVNDVRAQGRAFARRSGVLFPSAFDTQSVATIKFQLGGLPDTIFVNARGQVVHEVVGVVSNAQLAAGTNDLVHS